MGWTNRSPIPFRQQRFTLIAEHTYAGVDETGFLRFNTQFQEMDLCICVIADEADIQSFINRGYMEVG